MNGFTVLVNYSFTLVKIIIWVKLYNIIKYLLDAQINYQFHTQKAENLTFLCFRFCLVKLVYQYQAVTR